MKTNRRFLLAAIFGFALTFTFSCSSGGGSGEGGGFGHSGGGDGTSSLGNGGGTSSLGNGGGTSSPGNGGGTSSPSSGGGGNNKCTDAANCKKKQIGSKIWMAENLNIDVRGSKCYGEGGKVFVGYDDNYDKIYTTLSNAEIQANCAKYGRLYKWTTAMAMSESCNSTSCYSQTSEKHQGICPNGWHIPDSDDWVDLMKTTNPSCSYGNCTGAGTKLKATSGWDDDYEGKSGNGTDEFGFSALPGGIGYGDGEFNNVGIYGEWWGTWNKDTEADTYQIFNSNDNSISNETYKGFLLSVRCVQD